MARLFSGKWIFLARACEVLRKLASSCGDRIWVQTGASSCKRAQGDADYSCERLRKHVQEISIFLSFSSPADVSGGFVALQFRMHLRDLDGSLGWLVRA